MIAGPEQLGAAMMRYPAGLTFQVGAHWLTHDQMGMVARSSGEKRTVSLPSLAVQLPPGSVMDFAAPVTGFPGLRAEPHPDKVLRLWADDLLTVQHGDVWKLVLNRTDAFDVEWVDALFPPSNKGFALVPPRTLVRVTFDPLQPHPTVPASEVDPLPTAWVNIEDLRQDPGGWSWDGFT